MKAETVTVDPDTKAPINPQGWALIRHVEAANLATTTPTHTGEIVATDDGRIHRAHSTTEGDYSEISVTVTKDDVGLANVDNTSDADKPISDATQTALDGKATSAQGAKADTAVQPGDLHAVATSGSYNDLGDKPTIPPAAPVDSVAGETGAISAAALRAAINVEDGATADMTPTEILAAVESESGRAIADLADKSNVLEKNNTTAFTPAADYEPATKKYVDDNAGSSPDATTTTKGIIEIATQAEADAATATDKAMVPSVMRVKFESGNKLSVGDLGGDARGGDSITIQPSRSSASQVGSGSNSIVIGSGSAASGYFSTATGANATASGDGSTAVGYFSIASGTPSTAVGYNSTAVGSNSTATGAYATAGGDGSTAVGYFSTANGAYSTASGYSVTASGSNSTAIGRYAKTTTANSTEIGYWSNSATRAGAIRIHGDGQSAFTIRDSASAPTDGGATAGSEANGTLPRGMFTIQKNGTAVSLYYNNAGTIQSLSLGTLS